jgi:hypothetical protein
MAIENWKQSTKTVLSKAELVKKGLLLVLRSTKIENPLMRRESTPAAI